MYRSNPMMVRRTLGWSAIYECPDERRQSECDDPIQCTRRHEGDFCECSACDGRGYDQTVW